MMKQHRGLLLALLIFFSAGYASAADEVDRDFTFIDSGAGQKVEISGKFSEEGVRRVLLVAPGKSDGEGLPLAAEVSGADKNKLTFVLTNDVLPGRYFVKIQLGTDKPVVAGELRVPPLAEVQVTIAGVRPASPYPNPNPVPNPSPGPAPSDAKQYNFEIAGTNFSPILENNHIEIDDVPIKTPACVSGGAIPCLGTERGNETRKLIVYHYSPTAFSRPLNVSVRVGNGANVAKAPTPLVFSSVSKIRLQIYAVGAFALLLGILFLLVRTGVKLGKIDGQKYGSLYAFLLDKETNSYSLSKFQLTFFTLVTVFGYIYVFVCTLFVQWKFELPPVPEGLPGMMAVSLGTTVVAAGIGAKIGGKGAGPTSPSLADFITSGGVVLPERFQFFLWTIVSSVGVLVLILASDPVTVTELPKLPEGMLYLMGLSSAGYLGGKLVRGPGPSIKSIDVGKTVIPEKPAEGDKPVEPAATILEVTITGDNLSPDATFQLDDERIPSDQAKIVDRKVEGQDPKFCSMLKVQLRDVAELFFDGPHRLRIINPDTQGADCKYGATIDAVGEVKEGKVTVTGTNFKDPSSAGWTPDGGELVDLGVAAVTKKSDTELEITLTDLAGDGELAIISPGGLKTSKKVSLGE